ncbi:hypothetical protein AX14_006779 [Amanita brunnescens Koide BX004]|nr:hypothetical protein AX14_006779 [Amanita brunnescens Koide BX004]
MRLTTLAVAFVFISTVFATPIYPPRGVAFRKRSPIVHEAHAAPHGADPGKTHCKRADASEVKGALQRMDAKPFAAGSYGSLHDVNEKVDGERAVVKVIKGAKMGKAKIYEEVRNLIQVKQFLGWGHKASSDVYYIIMPHMGDPLEKTGMKEKDPKVKELTEEALARYKKDFHMIHGDPDAQGGNPSGNLVYKSKGHNQWEAELIDWGFAGPDPAVNVVFKPVPEPVAIAADDCVLSPPPSPKAGSDDGWEFRRRSVVPRSRRY